MKAGAETSIIGIVVVMLTTVALFIWASKEIFNFITQIFSEASAFNVATQLSNLMTVSGSSYFSEIIYTPTKDITYNIQIKSRLLKIKPNFDVPYAEKSSSVQPFATNFSDYSFSNVNSFTIIKRIVGDEFEYELHAKKE
ncbi:MAG: hypothetical protein QXY79_01295 [Candidatus Methanomethylicia archaeon]